MRDWLRKLFWRLALMLVFKVPNFSGAAEKDDEGDDEGDKVDEEELPDAVKSILKKERKAKRDAEKGARAAKREADERVADFQAQLSELEGKVESGREKPQGRDGAADSDKEVEELRAKVTELEGENEELKSKVETAEGGTKKARLLAELRNSSKYEIADDMIDLVAEQLDVDYNDAGEPQGVEDAVSDLLEKRPTLKKVETTEGEGGEGVSAGNAGSSRQRGGEMTREAAQALAKSDPNKFNEMMDKGEIPASALGGG